LAFAQHERVAGAGAAGIGPAAVAGVDDAGPAGFLNNPLMPDADISYISAMRTIIDLPDGQLRDLTALGMRTHQPRAALIREAIADYLARHRQNSQADAFGLWGSDGPDGLEYQARVRAEW
jgi:hypothetical protein